MKTKRLAGAVLVLMGCALICRADAPPAGPAEAASVEDAYPGLASVVLAQAKLTDLPEGVLLRCRDIQVGPEVVEKEIANTPAAIQEQFKKNKFFLLEQLSVRPLLLLAAREAGATLNAAASREDENAAIRSFLEDSVPEVEVSDPELADFYRNNQNLVGGAPLESVKEQLRAYLQEQNRQAAVQDFVRDLGKRFPIELQKSWVAEQAVLAKDNPVDKARSSGKPTLVEFGATGCKLCEEMAPIIKTVEGKYADKANVVFVHVRNEQVLASRYGIQAIPVQVFFDREGREIFRHSGFFSQEEIEKKLAEAGVQ